MHILYNFLEQYFKQSYYTLLCFITCNMSLVLEINYLILSYLINTWSTNGSKLTVMQNVVISVKTNMKIFLYLAFENSVICFRCFSILSKE